MNLRAAYQHQRELVVHRHRTNLIFRRILAACVWAGAALVVVAAVGVRHARVDNPGVLPTVVLAIAVVAAVLALLRPAVPPHAHNLAGYPERPCDFGEWDLGVWVLGSRWGGGITAVVYAFGVPDRLVLGVAAVSVGFAIPVITYRFWVRRETIRLKRALATYGPRFAIAYAGFAGGPMHLAMWEGPLLRSGLPGVIFNYRADYCAYLRENAELVSPFVQLSTDTIRDLRQLIVPGLGTFFYVHNGIAHLRYLAMRNVRHVWLGHGDSDKPGSSFARHAKYDLLVMSGAAAIDRYARSGVHIPPEKFVVLGRPQVGDIEMQKTPIGKVERPVVLYAPTWQGKRKKVDFSSLTVGADIVRALITADVDVMFRPHPMSSNAERFRPLVDEINHLLARDSADPTTPGQHLFGELPNDTWSIADCINRSDALISDVSSVVSDWLQSGKPYAMVSTRWSRERFRERFPVSQTAYVLLGDMSNLDEVLDDLLSGDPLGEARRESKRYVLGDFVGDESAEAFAEFVRELARRGA